MFDVRQFGALGNGVTDDTAAIQTAIDTANNHIEVGIRGGDIVFPPGAYVISDTLRLHRFSGRLRGAGWTNPMNYGTAGAYRGYGTSLQWAAIDGNAKAMLEITDSLGVIVEGLRFEGRNVPAQKPLAGIRLLAGEGHSVGTNGHIRINNCWFGSWPWSTVVTHHGDMLHGILVDGLNTNNDTFVIDQCVFRRCDVGLRIVNTQSVWSHMKSLTFDTCGTGIETAASNLFTDIHFNQCALDFSALSSAKAWVRGFYSENSAQLARLAPPAGLFVDGGYVQLGSITEHIIDAYPCGGSQRLIWRNVLWNQTTDKTIRVLPETGAGMGAGTPVVKFIDNMGNLTPAHLQVAPVDEADRRRVIWQDDTRTIDQTLQGVGDTLAQDGVCVDYTPVTVVPHAPHSGVRLFVRNADKPQLCALFPSGSVQVIASEP